MKVKLIKRNEETQLRPMIEDNTVDLKELLDKQITVRLKGGRELKGTLSEFDEYMNLVLKNVEEIERGETTRKHQIVVVKGGNTKTIVF